MTPYQFPYASLTDSRTLDKTASHTLSDAANFILSEVATPSNRLLSRETRDFPYRRLLPQTGTINLNPEQRERLENALKALGNTMREKPPGAPKPPSASQDISYLASAGYTYLGQFIGHDLTHDLTKLDNAAQAAAAGTIRNKQRSRLGLDNLYGKGPTDEQDRRLYVKSDPRGEERFALGLTVGGQPCDLQRPIPGAGDNFRNGDPLVADAPHLENLLLSQLTAVFMRFHNAVLGRAQRKDPQVLAALPPQSPEFATLFDRVRQLVIWHYQWVAIHDFLPQIINQDICDKLKDRYPNKVRQYRDRIRKETPAKPDFLPPPGEEFCVSLEFAMAAMRYGHSAVKPVYVINHVQPGPVPTESLVDRTKFTTGTPAGFRLKDDWVVDWNFFFGGVEAGTWLPSAASPLDIRIVQALHGLDKDEDKMYPQLPVRTLLRGARIGLPSGQELARALGEPVLQPDEILSPEQLAVSADFEHFPFRTETPLYYYLLKEAEKENQTSDWSAGPWGHRRRLGPVGSRLVGETIYAALYCDNTSILRPERADWRPPLGVNGGFGMADLIRIAQMDNPKV